MALEMRWLEIHLGTLEKSIELANRYYWFTTIFHGQDKRWHVKSGESVILSADTREAVDAFLYGMGLAYAGIPDDLFEHIIAESKDRFI